MEKLSDFKILERIALPDIGDLQCSGLIVVVGPNSSGKSQFLLDIYNRVCGDPRKLVVAKKIAVSKPPDYTAFVRLLETEGYFSTFTDENGATTWRPRTTFVGSGQAVNQINKGHGQNWHSSYAIHEDADINLRSEFLNYFYRLLVAALFLDRRLTSLGRVGVIDYETQAPQNDLHALYLDDDARQKLFQETIRTFDKAVWPDASRGNILCLRVSDSNSLPSAEDRLS